MNPKSMTQMDTCWPSISAMPRTAASRRPVWLWAVATRSGYAFWSTKPSGSTDWRPGVALAERALVEEQLEPGRRRQAEVVVAGRADPVRLLELLVEQHVAARRALRPQVRRVHVAARAERRQLDGHLESRLRLPRSRGRRGSRGPSGRSRAAPREPGAGEAQRGRGHRAADQELAGLGALVEVGVADARAADRGAPTGSGERPSPGPRRRPRPGAASTRPPRRDGGRGAPRTGTTGGSAAGRWRGVARRRAPPRRPAGSDRRAARGRWRAGSASSESR